MEAEEPAEAAEGAFGLNALPDELVMQVFSKADCVTLLDTLPLVCKRWHRLARDPDAWAGQRFRFRFYDHKPLKHPIVDKAKFARVLLHAPAAASLVLRVDKRPWRPSPRLFSALRCSRALVRKVDCQFQREEANLFWPPLLAFLQRQRELRELRLVLRLERTRRTAPVALPPPPAQLAQLMFGGLQVNWAALHGLHRHQDWPFPAFVRLPYDGELAARLPALRVLRLEADDTTRFPEGFVADLVRGATQLRALVVDMPPRGPVWDACAALPCLQHVELVLKQGAGFPGGLGQVLRDASELCVALRTSLRTATFRLRGHDLEHDKDAMAALRKLVSCPAFRAQLPNVDLVAVESSDA